MPDHTPAAKQDSSRRDFLKTSTTAIATGALTAGFAGQAGAYAAGSDVLKVALVGCGGRGTGAATQALSADPNTRLVAMADAFIDRIDRSHGNLKKLPIADRIQVDSDHKFAGFDAYKNAIDAADVVVLAATPHFRPRHLRYAVEAGKHVFAEKPIAVDAPGVRSVMETSELAKNKGLSLVSGLCWRYNNEMRATFDEIHKGTAGDIVAMQCSYCTGGVWEPRKTREECNSEMEYQIRNWYYYTWLSGDFNVEQHIHSLDKMLWAMQDEVPLKAVASGGRQVRTDPKYGNIYDHFDVVYEWKNGLKAFARCRHWPGCKNDVSDHIYGTKGHVDVFKHRIKDRSGETIWRYRGQKNNMYQTEHDELFASIRNGKPINNGGYMCKSSMLAILGRMVAYTGQEITWDDALNDNEKLGPATYEWGHVETPKVAIPGRT